MRGCWTEPGTGEAPSAGGGDYGRPLPAGERPEQGAAQRFRVGAVPEHGEAGPAGGAPSEAGGGHCCGEGSWCAVRTVPEAFAGEFFGELPGLAERGDDPDPGGGDLRNDPGLFLPGGGPHEAAGGLFRLTIPFSSD